MNETRLSSVAAGAGFGTYPGVTISHAGHHQPHGNGLQKGMRIMSRNYIFTKRFFSLSPSDQTAVVDAAIRDLETALVQLIDPMDGPAIRRAIRRIERKAIEYGVYEEETHS